MTMNKITINPREQLTKKAHEAIYTYCEYFLVKKDYYESMRVFMNIVLKAERMKRADLYAWLEDHDYRWNGRMWFRKERS